MILSLNNFVILTKLEEFKTVCFNVGEFCVCKYIQTPFPFFENYEHVII